jgi:hypothetical protein
MNKTERLTGLVESGVNRRDFAKRTIVGSLAAMGLSLTAAQEETFAQEVSDLAVLQFALNLEYLEAEFYAVATTGQRIRDLGIEVGGRGRAGDTTGGAKVSLDPLIAVAAEQVRIDELAHVVFLRAALGGQAVAKPAINLEALGLGFRNQAEFLALARAFEDLGMSAYGGAAPLIDSSRLLGFAARIALTEAQHAGVFRYLVAQQGVVVPQVDKMDVPPLGSPAGRLFQVESRGLTTIRTPSEVLAVAGPFFPNGVNGMIDR